MQANCRYGPAKAYLFAAGVYPGDHGIVWNRNYDGSWLWVKWDNVPYACWISAWTVEVEGDVFSVIEYYHPLPKSTLYGPPQRVWAERQGNEVTVSWKEVWMTEDDFRGYLIEAFVCQKGYLIGIVIQTDEPTYTFKDEQTCSSASSGKLYTVEKHGYTDPVAIPWPE